MFGWLRRAPSPRMEQRSRVSNALADYPPYTPDAWDDDPDRIEHATYTKFFLENREDRLAALRIFLAKFDVAPDLDDAGLMAVSAWCPLYADLLVDSLETDAVWSAYHQFAAAWVGPLLGLNAIFDLGVYCGECVLLRNPKLKWQPLRGPDHYVQHPILGQKYQRSFDPVGWMYVICRNIYNEKTWDYARIGGPLTKKDDLYRHIHWQAIA
jgi:hypothetical protein